MNIICLGNPLLREHSVEVTEFDQQFKDFIKELAKTMYVEDGVGLAAPQVGVLKRVFVFDDGSGLRVMVNPVILEISEEKVKLEEGCLSVPGIYADVIRPKAVKMRYQDIDGNVHEEQIDEYAGRIVQHEGDHLDGVLFIDHISPTKKTLLRSKLAKIMKENN